MSGSFEQYIIRTQTKQESPESNWTNGQCLNLRPSGHLDQEDLKAASKPMLRAVSHVLLLVGIILVRLPNQFYIKQQALVVPHPIPLLMEASKAETSFGSYSNLIWTSPRWHQRSFSNPIWPSGWNQADLLFRHESHTGVHLEPSDVWWHIGSTPPLHCFDPESLYWEEM